MGAACCSCCSEEAKEVSISGSQFAALNISCLLALIYEMISFCRCPWRQKTAVQSTKNSKMTGYGPLLLALTIIVFLHFVLLNRSRKHLSISFAGLFMSAFACHTSSVLNDNLLYLVSISQLDTGRAGAGKKTIIRQLRVKYFACSTAYS